ncbi:MAG: APC family permease [Candidatus Nanopelagicales bacterium]
MAAELRRVLGVGGATVVGLGAMIGTGVFVAWTPALALAGSALIIALGIAAIVASLNATSTAALARALPEAGGAYAYGRRFLSRPAGVIAGYAFVVGKSASAGAAALTIGAYAWPGQERLIGVIAVVVALALDLRGIVKSVRVTALLIAVVLAVLLVLAITALAVEPSAASPIPAPASPIGVVAAAGILFVAFAGYARITVLGEEVQDPARTIPRAMVASFAVVIVVYVVLAVMVIRAVSADVELGTAPLESIAAAAGTPALESAVRLAAVIAAGAVLLSLLAGVGRTLFAMGRGADGPASLAVITSRGVPARAEVLAAGLAIAVVVVGGIGFALALSAATILTYYSVAHLAVLARVRRGESPGVLRLVAVLGLAGCVVMIGALLVAAAGG